MKQNRLLWGPATQEYVNLCILAKNLRLFLCILAKSWCLYLCILAFL